MSTTNSIAQQFRDFAADEAQDVSQGIFEDALRIADEIEAGDHNRDEAKKMLKDLREKCDEVAAE